MGETVTVRFLVAGRVQGVFYRASTQSQAQVLGLAGWARNLPDGRVEVLARGLSSIGTPYLFHIEQWNVAPNGIDLIGGDDFMGQDFAGGLIAHGGKYGTWKQLTKTH